MQHTEESLSTQLTEMAQKAKNAARLLAVASSEEKNRWLGAMADALMTEKEQILTANRLDLANGAKTGLSKAMMDRLTLTEERIHDMAEGIRHVISLQDPAGKILSGITRPNGLKIQKVSVPIGVIGIIYESRPNVTVDSGILCLKAGNAVILRGGSEAIESNRVLASIIEKAGQAVGMPDGAVNLIPVTDRNAVSILLKLNKFIDLIIPRGGEGLIRAVVEQATMPVIKHYKGVCHIYVDETYPPEDACRIIRNAKCQRTGVCNALESLLIDRKALDRFVPVLVKELADVEFHGDTAFCKLVPSAKPVTEEELDNEYLDLKLSVSVVDGLDEAVDHINRHGSGHSDSILTMDMVKAEAFLNRVDSAAVYVNASTRFTDGGEFGMGAEIGISTDKIHARGPMGLDELTIYKYKIRGTGQIR